MILPTDDEAFNGRDSTQMSEGPDLRIALDLYAP